jgi:hypothetical protein
VWAGVTAQGDCTSGADGDPVSGVNPKRAASAAQYLNWPLTTFSYFGPAFICMLRIDSALSSAAQAGHRAKCCPTHCKNGPPQPMQMVSLALGPGNSGAMCWRICANVKPGDAGFTT